MEVRGDEQSEKERGRNKEEKAIRERGHNQFLRVSSIKSRESRYTGYLSVFWKLDWVESR